jgi:hypothetical protein
MARHFMVLVLLGGLFAPGRAAQAQDISAAEAQRLIYIGKYANAKELAGI